MNKMDWVSEREREIEKDRAEGYFNIKEGDNRIQLLTHCESLAQVFDPATKKYRSAVEGEKASSIKGVCWVLQDGKIKQAKLPYTVVKAIKSFMEDPDYAFEEFPMPRMINIKAKNAGTKSVEYTVLPSPKETAVPEQILEELKKKPSPEEVVEKIKNKGKDNIDIHAEEEVKYPEEEVDPEDIPF